MKKVLILTVTAGNGHNSAAYAMKRRLEETGQAEVKVVDIIKEYTSKFNSWIVDKGYNLAVGYLRPIYDLFYNSYFKYNVKKASVCPPQASVKSLNGKLLKLIYEFKPDVIYGTSYYCGMALSNLRRVYKLPSVNIVCMLDYVVSPFWEASIGGADFLTLSHEDFRKELLEKGFSPKSLVMTGIPVSEKFSQHIDKNEARERLGLEKDLFTVLILYGGGHWQGSYKILKSLLKKIKTKMQIVVVNGRNEKTKNKIDKEMKRYPKNFVVKNIGFSKEVDVIMSACDVMIGKGGGLSTTESINKELPLIATTKLPGQEYFNIKFLQDKGLAFSFKNGKELTEKINFLQNNSDVLACVQKGLKEMKTNAIETIAKLIMEQKDADYSDINTHLDYKKTNKIVNRARKRCWKEIKKSKK